MYKSLAPLPSTHFFVLTWNKNSPGESKLLPLLNLHLLFSLHSFNISSSILILRFWLCFLPHWPIEAITRELSQIAMTFTHLLSSMPIYSASLPITVDTPIQSQNYILPFCALHFYSCLFLNRSYKLKEILLLMSSFIVSAIYVLF